MNVREGSDYARTLEETESHLNMCALNRREWEVYSDDKVFIRKMERIGAQFLREDSTGLGRFYLLRDDQILFRKGKKNISEAQREAGRAALEKARSMKDVKDPSSAE